MKRFVRIFESSLKWKTEFVYVRRAFMLHITALYCFMFPYFELDRIRSPLFLMASSLAKISVFYSWNSKNCLNVPKLFFKLSASYRRASFLVFLLQFNRVHRE